MNEDFCLIMIGVILGLIMVCSMGGLIFSKTEEKHMASVKAMSDKLMAIQSAFESTQKQ